MYQVNRMQEKEKYSRSKIAVFWNLTPYNFFRQLRTFQRKVLLPSYNVKTEAAGSTKC